ncbi:YopX family protein [Brevibacillus laterosporus]|uniref:YopX family protein n=1 Tax=Brevibacillus laterosporus TaxID=1465 RepID=UPI003D1FBD76
MREMKFQAYWKEKGIMLGVSSIDFSTYVSDGKSSGLSRFYTLDDYEDESNYIPKGTNFNLYLDEVEIRQYIGLKDCNGKEIYEGGILKGKIYDYSPAKRFIGVLEYGYSGFLIKGVKQYKGMIDHPNATYEVIGNIYQNPELL